MDLMCLESAFVAVANNIVVVAAAFVGASFVVASLIKNWKN
jgi:hypothetical protein